MGRFRCVACNREYHDKRFLWEVDGEEEAHVEAGKTTEGNGAVEDDPPEVAGNGGGIAVHRPLAKTQKTKREAKMRGVGAVSAVDELGIPADAPCAAGTTANAPGAAAPAAGQDAGALGDLRLCADALRAAGTAANALGAAAPVLSSACSPVSAVGGIVGAVGGASQLAQGLSMPSGEVDPHLVVKGSVTVGVGSACMALGIAAAAVPPLFLAALGLGAAGLCAAGAIDASMSGLCHHCRVEKPLEAEDTGGDFADHSSEGGSNRVAPPRSVMEAFLML